MRPASITQTGIGQSAVIPHDYLSNNRASLSTVISGSVNYTIQHTYDDVFGASYNPTTGNWFDSDDPQLVGATSGQDSLLEKPVRGTRINQIGGSGSVTLTVIQGIKS